MRPIYPDEFLPKLYDLLQDRPRPWAYPFAGGCKPDPNRRGPKPRAAGPGKQNWDEALDNKRLQWLERRGSALPPKPRNSGIIIYPASEATLLWRNAPQRLSSTAAKRCAASAPSLITPHEFYDSMAPASAGDHADAASPSQTQAASVGASPQGSPSQAALPSPACRACSAHAQ